MNQYVNVVVSIKYVSDMKDLYRCTKYLPQWLFCTKCLTGKGCDRYDVNKIQNKNDWIKEKGNFVQRP